jgi:hypothetical protein
MFLKCQNFYTLGVEEYFTKTGDFTWRVSDCEELVGGYSQIKILRMGDVFRTVNKTN